MMVLFIYRCEHLLLAGCFVFAACSRDQVIFCVDYIISGRIGRLLCLKINCGVIDKIEDIRSLFLIFPKINCTKFF